LPQSQSGYGKPLGNKYSRKLASLLIINLPDLGIRVVYGLLNYKETGRMIIVVISLRDDDRVYRLAAQRLTKI